MNYFEIYRGYKLLVMIFVLFIHATVLAIKFYAYSITDSSAILSDALEGIVNLVASLITFGSVWLASIPPDETHPYGHGKIEYFSVGFEGSLIVFAATMIFIEAIPKFFEGVNIKELCKGLGFVALGASFQVIAIAILWIAGKKTKSPGFIAEAWHIFSDVLSTVAVGGGLFLAKVTGFYKIDPLIAVAVAIYILLMGARLVKEAFKRLMDTSDRELLERITEVLKKARKDYWIDIHKLRARRYGSLIHVDLHLILPRDIHLWEAHQEAREIEKIITESFNQPVEVLIHIDPCEESHCSICRKYGCSLRNQAHSLELLWNYSNLSRRD